jgi:hypothetical protein
VSFQFLSHRSAVAFGGWFRQIFAEGVSNLLFGRHAFHRDVGLVYLFLFA